MKKTIGALILAAAFLSSTGSALAYQLPEPVVVKDSSMVLGAGEVDFTRPSVVEGTFTVDKTDGGEVYITAGDVANGAAGYGFVFANDMIHVISNDGNNPRRMPLAFVFPGQSTTVRATYTPHDGIRVDTASASSVFKQYSRGIVMDNLPTLRFAPGFSSKSVGIGLTVGSWKYVQ